MHVINPSRKFLIICLTLFYHFHFSFSGFFNFNVEVFCNYFDEELTICLSITHAGRQSRKSRRRDLLFQPGVCVKSTPTRWTSAINIVSWLLCSKLAASSELSSTTTPSKKPFKEPRKQRAVVNLHFDFRKKKKNFFRSLLFPRFRPGKTFDGAPESSSSNYYCCYWRQSCCYSRERRSSR